MTRQALVGLLLGIYLSGCAAQKPVDLAPRLGECASDVKKLAAALESCSDKIWECRNEQDDVDEEVVFCKHGELKL